MSIHSILRVPSKNSQKSRWFSRDFQKTLDFLDIHQAQFQKARSNDFLLQLRSLNWFPEEKQPTTCELQVIQIIIHRSLPIFKYNPCSVSKNNQSNFIPNFSE